MTDDKKRIEEIRSAPYGSPEGRKADVEFLLAQMDARDARILKLNKALREFVSESDCVCRSSFTCTRCKAHEALGEE